MTKFNREITVKEEIELLDAYLSIQSTRYRDRLDYSINIDESLCSYVIPALSFQPIVENTIVHGCEKKEGKTFIEIYSVIEENCIKFCFKDNANGIDGEKLKCLLERLGKNETQKLAVPNSEGEFPKEKSGIGLINVNKRIKMKFGEEYGLKIQSKLNEGTLIEIIVPNKKGEG
jgi:two-component system sensor histidine kinase YesM